jgi:polysaccharide biosynthesis protein PslJ
MRVLRGSADRGPVVFAAVVVGSLAVLLLAAIGGLPPFEVIPVVAGLGVAFVAYRVALSWRALLALLVGIILFIPIKRYQLPGQLAFDLEPYRLLVAILFVGWGAALLVDPRVRLRKSGYGGPLFLVGYSALLSELVNNHRITQLNVSSDVVKGVMFLFSFLLVFVLIVSVVRRQEEVDFLLTILVSGGTIVAIFSLVERATHFNVFNHLGSVIPLLKLQPVDLLTSTSLERGGGLRVYASAQHPIALGALLVMLIPLAIYLARSTGRSRWWVCCGLLGVAAVATVSRTSVVMLAAVALALFSLRPRETRRLWPVLVCALVAVPLAAPGALGTLRNSFFPQGGLVAQQELHPGTRGSGRLADVGPSLKEWSARPLLGEGYATRVVDGVHANAPILDDQWLKTLLETGLLGIFAWVWLFGRGIRRMARAARDDPTPRGLLCGAIAASLFAFIAGMFFYDAFSFIQVTFVAFILLALAAVVVRPASSLGVLAR